MRKPSTCRGLCVAALLVVFGAACRKSPEPLANAGDTVPGVAGRVYDSRRDGFGQWLPFAIRGKPLSEVDASGVMTLTAADGDAAGMNLPLIMTRGTVEFEYRVISPPAAGNNLFVYVIPMQANRPDRSGVEVGSLRRNDPANGSSPFRSRFEIPPAHHRDGQWHRAKVGFDFPASTGTAWVVLAPRVNEGAATPGAASFQIRNITISAQAVGIGP